MSSEQQSSHADGSLYLEAFDFPGRVPTRWQYMIASSPRSGSTYLSALLWRTGVFGAPLEYLNCDINLKRMLSFAGGMHDYWESVKQRRTSPNGTFGWKMFITNYQQLIELDPEALKLLSPDLVINLVRRNKSEHAVSYWRAITTKSWFFEFDTRSGLEYSYQGIRSAYLSLLNQQATWEAIFKITGTTPIIVCYEDLLSNPDEALRALLGKNPNQGEYVSEPEIPLPRLQRTDQTKSWAERYAREMKEHGDDVF